MIFVSISDNNGKSFFIKKTNHNELGGYFIGENDCIIRALYIELDECTVKDIESIMDEIAYNPLEQTDLLRIIENDKKGIKFQYIGRADEIDFNDLNELKDSKNKLLSWIK